MTDAQVGDLFNLDVATQIEESGLGKKDHLRLL